jgi:hypothetical protein
MKVHICGFLHHPITTPLLGSDILLSALFLNISTYGYVLHQYDIRLHAYVKE